ncbi:MAG: Gfo/Idh/MocA family oxidoreductase [Phycisphaeraceae bacterium]|nr:Gfo/Idh/MocA family oxidoreductase [Phycisphaeraceae bacterium]
MTASSDRKLRIAFIGAGGIAGAHMKDLAAMKDVEIVAMADLSEDSMAKHAKAYNIAAENCFTDYKKMLAKVKPDAVSVCTPNGMHAKATVAALTAGADVIVEKPMAMSAKEAQSMVDCAKKLKKKLVIGFQYRYAGNSQFLRKQVAEGRFGDILYVRCQALRRRGIPNWGVFGRKDLQGGGPMIDIGVHILECAHYVMGSPKPVAASGACYTYMGNTKVDTVSQWPNWDYKTYTVEDMAIGQIRFDNGAILNIEASFVAHTKSKWTFEIMGTKAGATWEPLEMFHDFGGYMINSTPDYLPAGDFGSNMGAKMRNFVDHCLYGKPTLCPAEDGLAVQKMLDAVYESSDKGKEVRIK